MLPVAVGCLVVAFAYLVCSTIFNPTPTKIDVTLAAPTQGFYSAKRAPNPAGKTSYSESTEFGLLTKDRPFHGTFDLSSPVNPISLPWSRTTRTQTYIAHIWVYSGCLRYPSKDQHEKPPLLTIANLENIKVVTDGQSALSSEPGSSGSLSVPNDVANIYWLEKPDADKKLRLSRFIKDSSKIVYRTRDDSVKTFISTHMLQSVDPKHIATHARQLVITANERTYTLVFEPRSLSDPNALLECRELRPEAPVTSGITTFPDTQGIASLLLDIEPSSTTDVFSTEPSGGFQIDGAGGWVSVSDLSAKDASETSREGSINAFSFRGGVKALTFNGKKRELGAYDEVTLKDGSLEGGLEPSGDLHFAGTANVIYLNQTRVNQTRWELMDTSIKVQLLSVIGVVFTPLLLFVYLTVKKNEQVYWL